ncbi:MAG: glucoamylase family protein [Chitinophagaceae bacterium]
MRHWKCLAEAIFFLCLLSCGKKNDAPAPPPVLPPQPLTVKAILLNDAVFDNTSILYGVPTTSSIKIQFSVAVLQTSVAASTSLTDIAAGTTVPVSTSFQNGDSTIVVTPASPLKYLAKYAFSISTALQSANKINLGSAVSKSYITRIDSSRKFPLLSNDDLLDKIQQQTFKYFWDFGHPVSGLARERNTSGETVTSGGSGFGVMAIITGVDRNFITRAQGLTRLQTITSFLKNTASKFHGAFPHWLNGSSGAVIPFSAKDNGADLVETAYLLQGLLCARQYFSGADAQETMLRNDINSIWNGVEWDWFRQNNQDVLYWHWSPSNNWDMNVTIRGWNECLVTYVLAASSASHAIPASVYNNGWALNGGMKNGNTYYGYTLPLGPANGGPLFFSHYSFLGINPNGLTDAYANYTTQTKNHTLINYSYCKTNPQSNFGYSDSCWGLTASDIQGGYTASSPTNDVGVIAPTAAIASLPYTPDESMKALKFFYYVLGDKLWKDYGFVDAFSLKDAWFADSFLAIDQGPQIIMIENYRSGLLWNLFTSCPEIKTGMKALGFTAPYL